MVLLWNHLVAPHDDDDDDDDDTVNERVGKKAVL